MANKGRGQPNEQNQAQIQRSHGQSIVAQHPLFAPLYGRASINERENNLCPPQGWASVSSGGEIHLNARRRGEPEEWAYVIAHCLLHLGFDHFAGLRKYREHEQEWVAACDCLIAKFLQDLKFARPPQELRTLAQEILSLPGYSVRSEEQLYADLCERGIPANLQPTGTAITGKDMYLSRQVSEANKQTGQWQALFSEGLLRAVNYAVDVAGGARASLSGAQIGSRVQTEAEKARSWFINSYPLLGALASSFTIIEDPLLCHRLDISIAAIDCQAREIYMNPAAGFKSPAFRQECRFVMAHELLHAGLRHDVRRQGRDPYLWNVACDYVINGWLIEMGIGTVPPYGLLHDPTLKGLSAEAIYDRIVTDMRRYRKLMTMRGVGVSDILDPRQADWWESGAGMDLDDFYRRSLSQGLEYHQSQSRGLLPAGLIEEIRALSQPPIPWDVELAQWFDHHFPPVEKQRTYARISRRQSSTPDIPRPLWTMPSNLFEMGRTYGVILDTSGSMNRELLAKALGTIASYSIARDVPAVRVIFCDAVAYDQGYMQPEEIAQSVKVRGRGGTILQPGIDLLEQAQDFPSSGPILIITDGQCDKLTIRREHAFLIPAGKFLPFVARGPVFRIK